MNAEIEGADRTEFRVAAVGITGLVLSDSKVTDGSSRCGDCEMDCHDFGVIGNNCLYVSWATFYL